MSHEALGDEQVLKEYATVLVNLRNPLRKGLGNIGLVHLHTVYMEEIVRRQLLPEATEIANELESQHLHAQ